jgi:hypothetical protein
MTWMDSDIDNSKMHGISVYVVTGQASVGKQSMLSMRSPRVSTQKRDILLPPELKMYLWIVAYKSRS